MLTCKNEAEFHCHSFSQIVCCHMIDVRLDDGWCSNIECLEQVTTGASVQGG